MRRLSSAVITAFLILLVACETEFGFAESIADEVPDFRVS